MPSSNITPPSSLSLLQALTTAMTRYKAEHGKALLFRGMRYLDVMCWQKDAAEEASRGRARDAMQRRARRAL